MNLMKWSQCSEEAAAAPAITTKTPKQRKGIKRGKRERERERRKMVFIG